MTNFKYICVLLGCLALGACSGDDERVGSSNVTTSQFFNSFIVVDDGSDQLYAEAQLTKGGPPNQSSEPDFFIDLERGDSLWISNGQDSLHELDFSGDLFDQVASNSDKHIQFRSANNRRNVTSFLFLWGYIVEWGTFYSATYDRPVLEQDNYTVSLVRDSGDDVINSRVTMPSRFDIAAPSAGFTFNRVTEELEIVWTHQGASVDQVELSVETLCADGSFNEVTVPLSSDVGRYTFMPGDLNDMLLVGTCNVTITVAKVNIGDLSAEFRGGNIQAQQARRLSLRSIAE